MIKNIQSNEDIYARLSIGASTVFITLLILLHIIKSDVNPTWNFISEYQLGEFGWLMRLAFFSLAVSCFTLFMTIKKHIKSFIGKIGILLMLLSGIGFVIGGMFNPDPLTTIESELTTSGNLHQMGAMLDNIPIAAILILFSLISWSKSYKREKRLLIIGTIIPIIGSVIFIISMALLFPEDGIFGPNVKLGWPNRIMILSHSIWLILISYCSIRINNKQLLEQHMDAVK